MMTDTERLDWLEDHKAIIQHHDFGKIAGPWCVMPDGGGHALGRTSREAIDKAVRLVARRQREPEQAGTRGKGR